MSGITSGRPNLLGHWLVPATTASASSVAASSYDEFSLGAPY